LAVEVASNFASSTGAFNVIVSVVADIIGLPLNVADILCGSVKPLTGLKSE
jgi:hypothetical protein